MIVFPNCKINLGLTITGKRTDGYHDLETVFYPVGLRDVLEIIPLTNLHSEKKYPAVQLAESGLPVAGDKNENLCVKAYHLLKQDHPLRPVSMHLHKNIPIGAGLGGGSSDGAFALKLLNDLFVLNLTRVQLIDYAVQLGSDCPFFIINKPCLATSRGEMMEEIVLDLSPFSMVLVNPHIHINTGWAFAQLRLGGAAQDQERPAYLNDVIHQPVSEWKEKLVNDFEKPVFAFYPEINKVKEELYRQGAIYASMTGSGSTVFGFFEKGPVPDFQFPADYTVITA